MRSTSNWSPHEDRSHPNWTSRTPSTRRWQEPLGQDPAPSWWKQALLVAAFLAALVLANFL